MRARATFFKGVNLNVKPRFFLFRLEALYGRSATFGYPKLLALVIYVLLELFPANSRRNRLIWSNIYDAGYT